MMPNATKQSDSFAGQMASAVQNVVHNQWLNAASMRNTLSDKRYCCNSCNSDFDDLTDSIFSGRHQPLRVWIACLYLMGLNVAVYFLFSDD